MKCHPWGENYYCILVKYIPKYTQFSNVKVKKAKIKKIRIVSKCKYRGGQLGKGQGHKKRDLKRV